LFAPRVPTLIFVEFPEERVETWKTPLDGAKEHRLEAYGTLLSRLLSDLSESSRSYRRAPGVTTQRRNVA
jgi:hypothetical protein